jgi:hypothetical protein
MAIFSRPEESGQTVIMAAIGALAPPQAPNGPSPFALSALGVAASALETAGLRQVDRGEVPITLDYPTEEIACRAFSAGGGGAQAIRHSGEERVRQTIRDALQRFRVETGPLPDREPLSLFDRPGSLSTAAPASYRGSRRADGSSRRISLILDS